MCFTEPLKEHYKQYYGVLQKPKITGMSCIAQKQAEIET